MRHDDRRARPPRRAASTTAKISSRPRCPVASTMPWRGDRLQHRRASRAARRRPRRRTGDRARPPAPSARSSCCIFAQTGSLAPGLGSVRPAVSFARVDRRATRRCARPRAPAISTASGFIPPTERLSAIAPSTWTPGRRPDDRRALGGRHVVRLQHEARQADLLEAAREARRRRCGARSRRARCGCAGRRRRGRARVRLRMEGSCGAFRRHHVAVVLALCERSHASAAAAMRGSTPSSSSIADAAAISSLRRTACRRLPSSSRPTMPASALLERPVDVLSQPVREPERLARRQRLLDGRGEPLHEDAARELARRGLAGLRPQVGDGHAQRRHRLPRTPPPRSRTRARACGSRGRGRARSSATSANAAPVGSTTAATSRFSAGAPC